MHAFRPTAASGRQLGSDSSQTLFALDQGSHLTPVAIDTRTFEAVRRRSRRAGLPARTRTASSPTSNRPVSRPPTVLDRRTRAPRQRSQPDAERPTARSIGALRVERLRVLQRRLRRYGCRHLQRRVGPDRVQAGPGRPDLSPGLPSAPLRLLGATVSSARIGSRSDSASKARRCSTSSNPTAEGARTATPRRTGRDDRRMRRCRGVGRVPTCCSPTDGIAAGQRLDVTIVYTFADCHSALAVFGKPGDSSMSPTGTGTEPRGANGSRSERPSKSAKARTSPKCR